MATALVAAVAAVAAAPGVNGGPLPPLTTTGATLIVVSGSWWQGGGATVTVTDSKGNVYIPLTAHVRSGTAHHQFFYCLMPIVGPGHIVTLAGINAYPAVIVFAFSGAGSYQTENGNVSVISPLACGSVTPSVDGALILSGRVANGTEPDTITPAGFTQLTVPYNASTNYHGSAAYLVQTTAGAINPTWTWTDAGTIEHAASAAVFLPLFLSPPTASPYGVENIRVGVPGPNPEVP